MKTLRKIITVCCLLAFMFIVNPVSAQENPTIEQMKDQLVQKGFTEEYLNVIEDELIEALYTDPSAEFGGVQTVHFLTDAENKANDSGFQIMGNLDPNVVTVSYYYSTSRNSDNKISFIYLSTSARWTRAVNFNFGELFAFSWDKDTFGYLDGSLSTSLRHTYAVTNLDNTSYASPSITNAGFTNISTKQKTNINYPNIITHSIRLFRKDFNTSGTISIIQSYAHPLLPTGVGVSFGYGPISISFTGWNDSATPKYWYIGY